MHRTKPLTERVRYYMRKVNSYGQRRMASLNTPSNRYKRLLAYRDAIRRRATEI